MTMKAIVLFSVFLVAIVCAGCGNGQDLSGNGELAKQQQTPPPTTLPSGGALTAHKGMMIPNQKHP
jgi:hypothetical protein